MGMPHELVTSYLKDALDINRFQKTVDDICAAIQKISPDVEGIAFRGSSGSLVAMSVCVKLGKFPMMIRKQDGNHSCYTIEGVHCESFVIVDDLVCTGSTVRAIIDAIQKEYGGPHFICDGVFCYTYGYSPKNDNYHSPVIGDGENFPVYGTDGACDYGS